VKDTIIMSSPSNTVISQDRMINFTLNEESLRSFSSAATSTVRGNLFIILPLRAEASCPGRSGASGLASRDRYHGNHRLSRAKK
jgi:hypothetical protein